MASMRNALSNVATNSRRANSPLPMLLLGVALIAFWVLATMLQIQTSEAFILNGPAVTFNPNWSILKQPIELVQGHLTTDMAKAAMWGWGIELIYLVCIVGYEVAHEGVRASNRHLAAWFRTGTVILIAFDAYTDFQYGQLASGFWGQVAFALVTAFIVAFFGIVGFRLIEHGLTEWSR
jgi:hypothetical protein